MSLPIVTRDRSPRKARIVHALRLGVIVLLAMLLPSPHGKTISERWLQTSAKTRKASYRIPTVKELQTLSESVLTASTSFNEDGLLEVFDAQGGALGHVARTLPDAERIVGYRGPTESLVLIDHDHEIVSVRIIGSHDTEEHVSAVTRSPDFFRQFVGMNWDTAPSTTVTREMDGVSGATLTSLALARGIFKRMGAKSSRGVFSRPLTEADALRIFPRATQLKGDPVGTVSDGEGAFQGTLIRTGGLIDDEMGYQGPTELLIGLGEDDRIGRIVIRESFDNEPYVGYLPQERSFFNAYVGKTFAEVVDEASSRIDVEGVSGATMTSTTVAAMILRVAEKVETRGGVESWKEKTFLQRFFIGSAACWESIRWAPGEIATLVILLALPVLIRAGWMRHRWARRLWLIVVIAVIGFWSGNLVSLALFAGVATSGISWAIAVGLTCMIFVTLFAPASTKSNPYCSHLCPHGAAQQIVRPSAKSRRHRRLPKAFAAWLGRLPAALLVVVYLLLLFWPTTDVSFAEPFHGYLWRVSGWLAIAFTMMTLVISTLIPMGYCRFGCPTGQLLEVVRFKATSAKLGWGDLISVLLLLLATGLRCL